MKKTWLYFLLLLLCASAAVGQPASVNNGDIVVLYENDVHGSIEGYPLMAALRDQMRALTPYVTVVSCGDFLSGTPLGSVSRGRYLVRLMNAVGYDYITLGNHECGCHHTDRAHFQHAHVLPRQHGRVAVYVLPQQSRLVDAAVC